MSVCAGAAARHGETKFHDPSRAIYLSTVSSHKQRGGGQHRMGGRGAGGRGGGGGGGFLLGGIGVNDAAGDRLANGSVPVHPAGGGGAASGMNDSADPQQQQQQQRRVWPRLDVSRSDDETPMMTEKLKPAAATTTTQAEQSALLNTADSETREPPPPPAAPADDCDDLQLVSAGEVGVAGSRDAGEVVGVTSTGENDTEAAAAVDVIERPRDIAVSTSHQQLQRSCAAQRGMAAAAGSDAGSRRGCGGTAGSEAGSQARSSSLSRRASPDHIPRLHECWSLEPVRRAHQHHHQPHGATRSNLSSLDSLPANLTQPPPTTSSSEQQQQQQPVRTAVS